MSAYAMPGAFFQAAPPCPPAKEVSATNSVPHPIPSSVNTEHKRFTIDNKDFDSEDSNQYVCAGGELGVTINSAKVDPVRLIQAVSKRSPTGNAQARRTRESQDTMYVNDHHGSTDDETDSDDYDCYFRRTVPSATSQAALSSKESEDHYKDAIQFELSISFNGRKYTATRTLPSFEKLRNELIGEIKKATQSARRRATLRRRRRSKGAISGKGKSSTTGSDSDTDQDSDYDEPRDEYTSSVDIPELPFGQKDGTASDMCASGAGFGGRGFTMLHATMKEYCPAMERWLRHVADLMPPNSSPSLTNFLWEPLDQSNSPEPGNRGNNANRKLCRGAKGSRSLSTLGSINEDEDDNDTDNESEESNDGLGWGKRDNE